MKVRMLLGALMALGLVGLPAQAGHTPDAGGCPIHVTDSTQSNPNVTDGAGDWSGELGQSQGGVPAGDIWREGTDVTAAWFHRDASGNWTGNIEINDIPDVMANAFFYFRWTHPDPDPALPDKSQRWLSARFKGYAPTTFAWGFFGAPVTPTSNGTFVTEGDTTGTVTTGPGGVISIDIPIASMGNPAAGDLLAGVLAEGRVLLGSPEPLPPPSPLRHGFVYLADDTTDGFKACDAYVN